MGEHRDRVHAVRVERTFAQVVSADLQHPQLTRLPNAGDRVDQHQRVVPVEQVVREVHAADAVVDHADAVGDRSSGEPAGHLGPEAVVAEEQVPDARDEDA